MEETIGIHLVFRFENLKPDNANLPIARDQRPHSRGRNKTRMCSSGPEPCDILFLPRIVRRTGHVSASVELQSSLSVSLAYRLTRSQALMPVSLELIFIPLPSRLS